jgi:methionyl-tRNA formyltransferase
MDRLNVLFCGYREWSMELYHEVINSLEAKINIKLVKSNDELFKEIDNNCYDLIFFIGWSDIIRSEIVESNTCIALHPSLLPEFRGGSPIQNQIINGVYESGLTFFRMESKVDAGPIIRQVKLRLDGDIKEIFNRIVSKSVPLILSIIEEYKELGYLNSIPQIETYATYFKRRTPSMSEITLQELKNSTAIEIHDKIRALQSPYPNAFIRFKDGSKLYLIKSRID